MIEFLYGVFNYLTELIHQLGYLGIVVGMTIESSAIPFPSEVVIPPAGALAHQGKMSMSLIILSGTIGSLIGALINYYVAYYLGRPFFVKYGKWVLVTEEKIRKAEEFFAKYGAVATFTCRFITVIRQLVSLPAGFAKMDMKKFIIYTSAGSAIWSAVLAFAGYFLGAGEDVIKQYKQPITIGTLALAAVVAIAYFGYQWNRKKAKRIAAS